MNAITKAETAIQAPAIGEPWPEHGGVYAGLSRGEDGPSDGHLVLLDDLPGKELKWADAVKCADGLGNGARLPTRFESALLYANVRDKIELGDWYWTGTQCSDSYAWNQFFSYGSQRYIRKTVHACCRALCFIQLTP